MVGIFSGDNGSQKTNPLFFPLPRLSYAPVFLLLSLNHLTNLIFLFHLTSCKTTCYWYFWIWV